MLNSLGNVDLHISINNVRLDEVEDLGITLDKFLEFRSYMSILCATISKKISFMGTVPCYFSHFICCLSLLFGVHKHKNLTTDCRFCKIYENYSTRKILYTIATMLHDCKWLSLENLIARTLWVFIYKEWPSATLF